jgi:hypothetical protein
MSPVETIPLDRDNLSRKTHVSSASSRRPSEGHRIPDPGLDPRDGDDEAVDAAAAPDSGTPRWAKVAGVIAVVILVMLLVALLSGGKHGPGRHLGGTGTRPVVAFAPSAVDDPSARTARRL